jgi:hypothetical protein
VRKGDNLGDLGAEVRIILKGNIGAQSMTIYTGFKR